MGLLKEPPIIKPWQSPPPTVEELKAIRAAVKAREPEPTFDEDDEAGWVAAEIARSQRFWAQVHRIRAGDGEALEAVKSARERLRRRWPGVKTAAVE